MTVASRAFNRPPPQPSSNGMDVAELRYDNQILHPLSPPVTRVTLWMPTGFSQENGTRAGDVSILKVNSPFLSFSESLPRDESARGVALNKARFGLSKRRRAHLPRRQVSDNFQSFTRFPFPFDPLTLALGLSHPVCVLCAPPVPPGVIYGAWRNSFRFLGLARATEFTVLDVLTPSFFPLTLDSLSPPFLFPRGISPRIYPRAGKSGERADVGHNFKLYRDNLANLVIPVTLTYPRAIATPFTRHPPCL